MSVNGEGPKPPKGRVRQFLGFVLIIGASVLALAAVQLLSPKGRSDSDLLLERLLEAGSKPTPFSTVMPDPDWDTVCYLGRMISPLECCLFCSTRILRSSRFNRTIQSWQNQRTGLRS